MTTVDHEVLEEIRARLRGSTRVGDERIQVVGRGDEVVLSGAVATPEEVTVAAQLAEYSATAVRNELVVDRGLREAPEAPLAGEPARPPAGEDLVGSTDMLAGPGAGPTEDMAQALDGNEPWSPPDVPQDTSAGTEEPGGVPPTPPVTAEEAEEELPRRAAGEPLATEETANQSDLERPSAPDVSAAELHQAAEGHPLPALDPTAAPPPQQPAPDPADDERTAQPAGDTMTPQVRGTARGPGAVGEPTTGGGALGGTPAESTRATGADTAPEDPAQGASGGVEKAPGTDPGPGEPLDQDVVDEQAARLEGRDSDDELGEDHEDPGAGRT